MQVLHVFAGTFYVLIIYYYYLLLQPSLWYKSPVKIATDNTASDSICIKAISRNVSSATLGHDSLAPSLVPVKCESIDPKIGGSAIVSVAVEYQDFPSPSLPLQNSSAHCPESCDPSVPIIVPTVQTSVPREVTENFSSGLITAILDLVWKLMVMLPSHKLPFLKGTTLVIEIYSSEF